MEKYLITRIVINGMEIERPPVVMPAASNTTSNDVQVELDAFEERLNSLGQELK